MLPGPLDVTPANEIHETTLGDALTRTSALLLANRDAPEAGVVCVPLGDLRTLYSYAWTLS